MFKLNSLLIELFEVLNWWIYFQLFMLIMIDVKLTPSVLWPPTCLYEWVDGVQEWYFSLLGELFEDNGSFLCLSV